MKISIIMKRTAICLAAAALLAGVCSGCEGSYSDGDLKGSSYAKEEYTKNKYTLPDIGEYYTKSTEQITNTPPNTEERHTESTDSIHAGEDVQSFIGPLGTAGNIGGTTVIVSIFAGDAETSWNHNSQKDIMTEQNILTSLITAGEWLEEQCRSYGRNAEFICDWRQNPDLYYRKDFKEYMVRYDGYMYDVQRDYIVSEIDSLGLKQKYKADNIVYILYFNTDYTNDVNPWTLSNTVSPAYNVELVNAFIRFKGFDIPPATIAHEIMHCFGAYDLYYESDAIPQAYVDYCCETNSRDIMYMVNAEAEITCVFTELDAYYTGLVGKCQEAVNWGLAESEH